MKFANFRSRGLRNRCEPCTCRTRSHFFFMDDNSAYNVDTGGTIWYQEADSYQWKQLYKCRNYIPWSGGVGRLDHVLRAANGSTVYPNFSMRVPCGRPMSGSFIGFQTDFNSCVVFYQGSIVYDGEYRSDCDAELIFDNQYDDVFFDAGYAYSYSNYLTEQNCNNNSPPGRDTPLYRNSDGLWDIDEITGVWTHIPATFFEPGDMTPVFTMSWVSDAMSPPKTDFGWGLATLQESLPYDTGMHLGTNETGSLVWFTTKKRNEHWWRFAGQVADKDDLPDIVQLSEWECTDEEGNPIGTGVNDYDVIVVGEGDYWDGDVYYLKDGQWIKHAGTYGEMVMSFPTGCVLHESTKGVTTEKINGKCVTKPDAWIGNIASVQSCGDLALLNANVKELDRIILHAGQVIAQETAVGRKSAVEMNDTFSCAFSKHYWGAPMTPRSYAAADGICFMRFTLADGSTRHIITYYDGEWTITWDETTAPNEPVWECTLNSNGQQPNSFWLAIGRTWDTGIWERKIFYKGELKKTNIYDPANYVNQTGVIFPIGQFAQSTAAYPCPRQNPGETADRYDMWDEFGTLISPCSEVYLWCNGMAISEVDPNYYQPKTETATASYSYTEEQRNYSTCAVTNTTQYTRFERVNYNKAFVPALGLTLYTGGNMVQTYSVNGGEEQYPYPSYGFTTRPAHIATNYSIDMTTPLPVCNTPRPEYFTFVPSETGFQSNGLRLEPCQNGWYADPPEVAAWVKEVDNDLQEDNEEGVEVSFDTTFVGIYGLSSTGYYPSSADTFLAETTTQRLIIPQSTGRSTCGGYPATEYNYLSTYEIPVWNRVFYVTNNYSFYYRQFSPNHQSYSNLIIPEDKDGNATGEFLVNLVITDTVASWRTRGTTYGVHNKSLGWTIHSDGTATKTFYCLQAEYEWVEDEYGYYYYDGRLYKQVKKYITHVLIIEADVSGMFFYNYRVLDYYTVEEGNVYNQTLFYKLCVTPLESMELYCGYVIETVEVQIPVEEEPYDYYDDDYYYGYNYYDYTLDYYDRVYWKGVVIYESPLKEEGTHSISCLCSAARMIKITEHRGGLFVKTIVFIDGINVWESSDENDKITKSDCCTIGEHRYALLGINDFVEEVDDTAEPVTLTDGTQAHCIEDDIYETDDGAFFIKNKALLKKTITDNRERYLFCNGGQIASNKRYDGIYFCGDFLLCTYVDDDYLSGWRDEWAEWLDLGDVAMGVDRKWSPNPGWGDAMPPTPKDFTPDGLKLWDYYKSVYPGFAVDVFSGGGSLGTFKLSDANSPIHYDHLGIGIVWLLFAEFYHRNRYDIGTMPWTLEGTPMCRKNKLLIPFDGGITTCVDNEVRRRQFP